MKRVLAPLLVFGLIALAAWRLWPSAPPTPAQLLDPAALAAALPASDVAQGSEPADGWTLALPRDRRAHPRSRFEVWDLSGLLDTADAGRSAFRLTLVRLVLRSGDAERASRLAADGLMLGRFEWLPADGEPVREERASRMAAGLAGVATGTGDGTAQEAEAAAEAGPARVWLENWQLTLDGAGGGGGRVQVDAGEMQLDLALAAEKQPLAPGAELFDGVGAGAGGSRANSAAPDPVRRYFVEPRLQVSGQLVQSGDAQAVAGTAWLDRAWGDPTAGAAGDQAGVGGGFAGTRGQLALNRFLLQLDDASELLCIELRRRAGGGTPIPTCLLIAADGETRLLQRRELSLVPAEETWRGADGAVYPIGWRLTAPSLGLELDIDALRPDQEVQFGGQLWSGAVTIRGQRSGSAVAGVGRMDLSGYAAADDG